MNELLRHADDFLGGSWHAIFACGRCGDVLGVVLADEGRRVGQRAAEAASLAEAADAGWLRGADGRPLCPACVCR